MRKMHVQNIANSLLYTRARDWQKTLTTESR